MDAITKTADDYLAEQQSDWYPPALAVTVTQQSTAKQPKTYYGRQYTLYGGEVSLEFYDRLGRSTHLYLLNGDQARRLTSVSAICNMATPHDPLMWWASQRNTEYCFENAALLHALAPPIDGRRESVLYPKILDYGFELEYLECKDGRIEVTVPALDASVKFKKSWYEALTAPVDIRNMLVFLNATSDHLRRRDEAANIGTVAHRWVQEYIKLAIATCGRDPEPATCRDGAEHLYYDAISGAVKNIFPDFTQWDQVTNAVNAFLAWTRKHDIIWLSTERVIYSRTYGYVGTMDWEARIDGRLIAGDLKTSNDIREGYYLQLAAYTKAAMEEMGIAYDDRLILRLSKEIDEGTPSFEARSLGVGDELEADFAAFLAAQVLHSRVREIGAQLKGGR